MRTPTREQQAVLESSARVRVVRSAPGSGKTWLVAELIRRELNNWSTRTNGIAALSFTRVGGDEIRSAVGYELGHPHFVGTIDAFLFRFVVRPFLQKCFPDFTAPRLIPGEWGAVHWGSCGPGRGATVGTSANRINLFGCVFIDEENDKAVVAHKPHPAQPLRPLGTSELSQVKTAKKQLWKRTGWLTHSDAALLASKILGHESLGEIIRAELLRRFPLIIVDELQDTGYFLGKSILLLVNESVTRSVLVGDPDQAIYEFNGARPDLFNRFDAVEGAVTLPLSNSRRFSSSVATVAAHLKDSGGSIGPADGKTGQTFLVIFDEMAIDIPRIVEAITTFHKGASITSIKVIARQTATVEALNMRSTKPAPKLGCPPLNHMQRAVIAFLQERQAAALAAARAAIELLVFQHEGVEETKLEELGIDPSRWRRMAIECLLRATGEEAIGNQYDWQAKIGRILEDELNKFELDPALWSTTSRIKPKKLTGWDKPCKDYLPQTPLSETEYKGVAVQTVHSVKGETHDVTVFVCPDKRANTCPSVRWWSTDEKDREEKRIAYVAMTRTQGDLIVCVSSNCYRRLTLNRSSFVESFVCKTVDEFVRIITSPRR
jgi:DNA helicase-2/ATP-dependent DNA helicase PcrA